MDIASVATFAAGFAAGLAAIGLYLPWFNRRLHSRYRTRLDQLGEALRDLRQERADDRETNRKLRRELAVSTPAGLASTRAERDDALDELRKLSAELSVVCTELADRDRSLRDARLAIHEIRVQLERHRFVPAPGAGVATS